MSYTLFFQKFQQGEPSPIRFEELAKVISPYGNIETDEFGFNIISSVGDLFETASLDRSIENGITSIGIHRPHDHDRLPHLIFDLLSFEGTCIFSQDLEFILTRHKDNRELPDDLVNACENELKVVRSPDECWPIDH